MDYLIFDLETNGLLADVNTIHSLVIKNVNTKEVISCANQDGYILSLNIKEDTLLQPGVKDLELKRLNLQKNRKKLK